MFVKSSIIIFICFDCCVSNIVCSINMVDINSVFLIDWCSSFFISIVSGTGSLWMDGCALLLYMCVRIVSA